MQKEAKFTREKVSASEKLSRNTCPQSAKNKLNLKLLQVKNTGN